MPSLTLLFKIHLTESLRDYSPREIGVQHIYFDPQATEQHINEMAEACYIPANKILLEVIRASEGQFRVGFSISGSALQLIRHFRPDVLRSFQALVNTGAVEILGETYYHSLSWLYSASEFRRQVLMHRQLIQEVFGVEPVVFRNTELIYDNRLPARIAELGFGAILCEGLEKRLRGRSPNLGYAPPGMGDFRLLLRNRRLSDDISFRFDDPHWEEHPLTAEKFATWIHAHDNEDTCNINLFMDYETFGLYKSRESGILDFLKSLYSCVNSSGLWSFRLPSETVEHCYPGDIYDVPETVSWEGREYACSFGSESAAQNNALKKLYSLEQAVMATGEDDWIDIWGRLQAAEYFYLMSEEVWENARSLPFRHPFKSPQEARQYFFSLLADFEIRLINRELHNYRESHRNISAETLF